MEDTARLTTKRAKSDRVIGPFIDAAKEEITFHHKFKIESLIKALNVQFYRAVLYRYMTRISQIVAKDLDCKLVAFHSQDSVGNFQLAGIGQGSKTIGYCKVGKENAVLSDAANSRRVSLTTGVTRAHNEVAEILQAETGVERDRLNLELTKLPSH